MVSDEEFQKLSNHVLQLEDQIQFLFKYLNITYTPGTTPENDPRIIELLQKGKKVEAISLFRELTNADLFTAKKVVEEVQARLGI